MYKIPQKNKTNKTRKLSGFTLVELIIVITILVILGTIAFLNLGWFVGSARDSARISNLTNLKKWLDIFQIKSGSYSMPENSITLMMSWGNIAFQWFAKDQIGSISKMSPGGSLDPSDRTMYTTYTTTTDRKKMQLMAFLEDRSSILSILTPPTYADSSTDYSKRYSYTTGDNVGILLSSGNLSPIQETMTGSIELTTTSTGYTVYFDNKTTGNGTGSVLQTAFVNNSVVYTVANSNMVSSGFITATGGTITTVGNYKVHTFTTVGTGTFQVLSGTGNVEYLVVAGGGGGGGAYYAGGGGGWGILTGTLSFLGVNSYLVTIGWGGTGGSTNGINGSRGFDSVFSTITSSGWGYGGKDSTKGGAGGSGGGTGNQWGSGGSGTLGQGNNGGSSSGNVGGGGWGGAGAVGGDWVSTTGGAGGAGISSSISGSDTIYSGGGWGGGNGNGNGGNGSGGGGWGGNQNTAPLNGTVNTGWGWGGANGNSGIYKTGGNGGSGIVIIRYQFQ